MIVCSCNVITDRDIERALVEIFSLPDAPIPTPGLVYRHLSHRMNCCGCAPLAVNTIYQRLEVLEQRGEICRFRCADVRSKLRVIMDKAATAPLRNAASATPSPSSVSARRSTG